MLLAGARPRALPRGHRLRRGRVLQRRRRDGRGGRRRRGPRRGRPSSTRASTPRRDLDQRGPGADGRRRPAREVGAVPRSCARRRTWRPWSLGTFTGDGRLKVAPRPDGGRRPLHGRSSTTGSPARSGRARFEAPAAARAGRSAREGPLRRRPARPPRLAPDRLQGVGHPAVRPRGAGRGGGAAAGRARTTGPRTPRSSPPSPGPAGGSCSRSGGEPRLRRRRPLRDGPGDRGRGDPQRGRRRRGPRAPGAPRQLHLGELQPPRAAREPGARRGGLPRRRAALRHAVHLREGLAQQRVPARRTGRSIVRPPHAAHLRDRRDRRRAPDGHART